MTINFKDPRLQRARQKIASKSKSKKAIFDAAAATSQFAENEMMKNIQMMQISNRLRSRKQRFNLLQKERVDRLDLAKDVFKFNKDQGKIATIISGAGLIPRSYLGYKSYQQSKQTADDMLKLSERMKGSTKKLYGGD